jgi:hypothetical protein
MNNLGNNQVITLSFKANTCGASTVSISKSAPSPARKLTNHRRLFKKAGLALHGQDAATQHPNELSVFGASFFSIHSLGKRIVLKGIYHLTN